MRLDNYLLWEYLFVNVWFIFVRLWISWYLLFIFDHRLIVVCNVVWFIGIVFINRIRRVDLDVGIWIVCLRLVGCGWIILIQGCNRIFYRCLLWVIRRGLFFDSIFVWFRGGIKLCWDRLVLCFRWNVVMCVRLCSWGTGALDSRVVSRNWWGVIEDDMHSIFFWFSYDLRYCYD